MTATACAQLIIGLVLAAYWGRVLRMAHKARRRGGSANFVPTEPLGRVLRIIWQPVVWLWIALPIASALLAERLPRALEPLVDFSKWIALAAAGVVVACFVATIVCWRKMGKSWRMGINPSEKTELVVSGPYAYLRHPIYALSALMMIATMAAAPSGAVWVVGVTHIALLYWEARREERHLLGLHGQPYRDYCARVGRFVPLVRSRL